MTIHFQNDRPAYTVLPDMVDEATGARVEDTGMLCETHLTAFAKKDQPDLLDPETEYDENIIHMSEEEALEAGYEFEEQEVPATELSNITDEVLGNTFTFDEAQADAVLQAPMGDAPGDVTITYLAHQYYSGNMTAEEAYNEALNSGVSPDELARSYRKLQSYFQ